MKQVGNSQPQITINGSIVEALSIEPNPDDILLAVEVLLPKMGKMKIAHGNASIDKTNSES